MLNVNFSCEIKKRIFLEKQKSLFVIICAARRGRWLRLSVLLVGAQLLAQNEAFSGTLDRNSASLEASSKRFK